MLDAAQRENASLRLQTPRQEQNHQLLQAFAYIIAELNDLVGSAHRPDNDIETREVQRLVENIQLARDQAEADPRERGRSSQQIQGDLIQSLFRRIVELGGLAREARQRELNNSTRIRLAEEIARDDPTIEDSIEPTEQQRAIGATREHLERAVRQMALIGGTPDTRALIRNIYRINDALRNEVIRRGGSEAGIWGQVEAESYDPERWEEAGRREANNEPRLHYDPNHEPQESRNHPLRENWPPFYQPGTGLSSVPQDVVEIARLHGRIAELNDNKVTRILQDRIRAMQDWIARLEDQNRMWTAQNNDYARNQLILESARRSLQVARDNLREQLRNFGVRPTGPGDEELPGELYDEERWLNARRRQANQEPRIHFDPGILPAIDNPRTEDWPEAYRPASPPPNTDFAELTQLRTQVQYLREENHRLRAEISRLTGIPPGNPSGGPCHTPSDDDNPLISYEGSPRGPPPPPSDQDGPTPDMGSRASNQDERMRDQNQNNDPDDLYNEDCDKLQGNGGRSDGGEAGREEPIGDGADRSTMPPKSSSESEHSSYGGDGYSSGDRGGRVLTVNIANAPTGRHAGVNPPVPPLTNSSFCANHIPDSSRTSPHQQTIKASADPADVPIPTSAPLPKEGEHLKGTAKTPGTTQKNRTARPAPEDSQDAGLSTLESSSSPHPRKRQARHSRIMSRPSAPPRRSHRVAGVAPAFEGL